MTLETNLGEQDYQAWVRETTSLDDLREAVDVILTELGDRNISPSYAGLFLQAIEDRRRELMYPEYVGRMLPSEPAPRSPQTKKVDRVRPE